MNLLLVVSRVVQFAYGEIVVISMYACWLIHRLTGSFIIAFIGSAIISVALTLLIEPILRGLRERKLLTETLVITIAVGMILTEVMSQFLNSGLPADTSILCDRDAHHVIRSRDHETPRHHP